MDGDLTVLQLRQHGIVLDPKLTPAEFTFDLLVSTSVAALVALGIVTKQAARKQFPSKLPTDTAARFGIAGTLAAHIQAAGYAACGYDAILYPTAAATKPLLAWMVAALGHAAESAAQRDATAANRSFGDAAGGLGGGDDGGSGGGIGGAHGRATALRRGLLRLQAAVGDKPRVAGHKSKAAAAAARAPPPPPRRRAAAAAALLFQAAPLVAWAEDASMLEQVAAAAARLAKVPALPAELATQRPSLPLQVRDAVQEAGAALRCADKGFGAAVAAALAPPSEAEAGSAAPPPPPALPRRARKPKARAAWDTTALGVAALFADTSEEGLSAGTSAALAARRAREKAQEAEVAAAEEALEVRQRSASQREAQRGVEAADIKSALSEAKRAVRARKDAIAALQAQQAAGSIELAAARAEAAEAEAAAAARVAESQEREQLLALMDDPDGSEARLRQQLAEAKAQRVAQREEVQARLLKVEAKKDELIAQMTAAGGGREEQLAALRRELKATQQRVKEKGREIRQLRADYENCPKDIDRSQFLRLIFDMTANIRKQQAQIDARRSEIAAVGAEIQRMEGSLATTFAQLEDAVYEAAVGADAAATGGGSKGKAAASLPTAADKGGAKGDDFSREAFRRVVQMREAYAALIAAIEQRGQLRHELHEADEKASKLQRLVEACDVDRVERDVATMAEHNDELRAQISKLTAATKGDGDGDDDDEEEEDGDSK